MKQKYLLSMLLGGALLTACSVEDDLNLTNGVQDKNSSAPVFTVRLADDDLTRATWNDDGNNAYVGLKKGDLLSLYHGVSPTSDPNSYGTFTGWGNAIYEGEANDGKVEFSTYSMVKNGGAVMIYPADTKFVNGYGDAAPKIRVDLEQTEETKKQTPYMSEILTINSITTTGATNNPGSHAEEGYENSRNYDIVLKRVGTTFWLTLKKENRPTLPEGVTPIHVDKVEMVADKAKGKTDDGPFTEAIPVTSLADASVARVHSATASGTHKYCSWLNQSGLDQTEAVGKNVISTTDLSIGEEKDVAIFTLLPVNTTEYPAAAKMTKEGGLTENDKIIAAGKGKVVISTNYGKVELTDESQYNDKDIWTKSDASSIKPNEKYPLTVSAGIDSILNNRLLWNAANTLNGNTFYKKDGEVVKSEPLGYQITRTLTVDMKDLNMDGLHVKDSTHLREVLAVYQALKPNGNVNLILDGEPTGNPNPGKFVMDKYAWKRVVDQLNTTGNKVSFSLCTEENPCSAVLLVNEDAEAEVPELRFKEAAKVELAQKAGTTGKWKYNKTNSSGSTGILNIDKVSELVVKKNATLDLANTTIGVKDGNTLGKVVVEHEGTVNVAQKVAFQLNMDNKGEINITEAGWLRIDAGKKLENCASTTNGFGEGGVIKNSGVLGMVEGTDSKIYNYGTIYVESPDAATLVSTNSMKKDGGVVDENEPAAGAFAQGFNKTSNAIGSIVLYDIYGSNNRTKVNDPDRQGFIKLDLAKIEERTEKKITKVTTDEIGKVANYIVINNASCTSVETVNKGQVATESQEEIAKTAYIEVNNGKTVVFNNTDLISLTGLVVTTANDAIDIPRGKGGVNTKVLYLQGLCLKAGAINTEGDGKAIYEGYYDGDEDTDKRNVTTY